MNISKFLKGSKFETTNKITHNVILHFHIFKNAGSTIEWILGQNFPGKTISIDGKNPGDIVRFSSLLDILEKKDDIKAISSHQIRFPIPETNYNFIPIVFIRHPIDRAFSIYFFKNKQEDDSIGSIKARELNLEQFIDWNLKMKKYFVMKNFQVLFLSKDNLNLGVDESDLKIAKRRMEDCDILGVVDRMDESLVVAYEKLKKVFPNIDLTYKKQNVSPEREENLEVRLKKDYEKINKELLNELILSNKFDLKLYEYANDELDRRIKKIDKFEEKLQDFKSRCKILK